MTMETSIYDVIGLDNETLNTTIQAHLDGPYYNGPETTVADWRIEKYKLLRQWLYPPISDYIDAHVKLNSDITELAAQGQQELEEYTQDCLNVKIRFPKE